MRKELTPRQQAILEAARKAARRNSDAIKHDPSVPFGVYRSLIIRGLLEPLPGRYRITEQGRARI